MALSPEKEKRKRLIVLVPESLAGKMQLAQKVYWMALRDQRDIFYLTLVDNDDDMLSAARLMATMKAVTTDAFLTAQSKVVATPCWLKTLHEIYQPGDRVVCHAEQTVKRGWFHTTPITEFLQTTLRVPVITISGFYHPEQVQVRQWIHTALSWLGFLLILTAFSVLEIKLDHALQGFVGRVILAILVVMEIGVIWAWNSITS